MEFSFNNLKKKLVRQFSGKVPKEQVERAFEEIQKGLIKSFKDAEIAKETEFRLFQSTKEYDKMKNISYWIFNNYGIPEDNKCVFETYLSKGFVLAQKTNHKDQLYEKVKSGVLKRAFIEIISEYITEYIGDFIISRRNREAAYHLAVVVDDAAQGITHVVRGEDLKSATPIHVLLQQLLDYPTPAYIHHPLIRDAAGKRLAKRDDAKAISKFRAEGASLSDIRAMIGL
jgi:hypothetical protein